MLQEASLNVCDHYGYSVLLWAAVCGRVSSVRLLTETNDRGTLDEPEEEEKGEWSSKMLHPLHGAASVGSVEVCQVLLDGGGKEKVISVWENRRTHTHTHTFTHTHTHTHTHTR